MQVKGGACEVEVEAEPEGIGCQDRAWDGLQLTIQTLVREPAIASSRPHLQSYLKLDLRAEVAKRSRVK